MTLQPHARLVEFLPWPVGAILLAKQTGDRPAHWSGYVLLVAALADARKVTQHIHARIAQISDAPHGISRCLPLHKWVKQQHHATLPAVALSSKYRCRAGVFAPAWRRQIQHIKSLNLIQGKEAGAITTRSNKIVIR